MRHRFYQHGVEQRQKVLQSTAVLMTSSFDGNFSVWTDAQCPSWFSSVMCLWKMFLEIQPRFHFFSFPKNPCTFNKCNKYLSVVTSQEGFISNCPLDKAGLYCQRTTELRGQEDTNDIWFPGLRCIGSKQHTCIFPWIGCSTFSWTGSANKLYLLLLNQFFFCCSYYFDHKNNS